MFDRFFISTRETATSVSRALGRGEIRRIRRGLYTTDLATPLSTLVRQHVWEVVRLVFPGHVIGYRTAIEFTPSPEGVVHLVGNVERRIDLHGLKVWCHEGPGPLEGDRPYMGSLHLASRARAYLEVLRPSRSGREFGDKGIAREGVEARLDALLRLRGEGELNRLRDDARALQEPLQAQAEFVQLDTIIGALLRTKVADLRSPTARARASGRPYDPDRLVLFQELHRHLLVHPLADVADTHPPGTRGFSHAAFFDAYFSNWIEGTEFELQEAREIVLTGRVPEARPADGHDVLGTFELVSDPSFMTGAAGRILADADAFIDTLKEAHRRILGGRPEREPGLFKVRPNRAGTTVFVDPDLVEGTLREAHGLIPTLPHGLAQAVYLMFIVTEVHPFADGNGRVARAIVNAALATGRQPRVIIVNGYRDDYQRALKAMSQQRATGPFVQMLTRAQRFVSELPMDDYDRVVSLLYETGALDPSGDRRLRLPSELGGRGHA